MTHVSTAPVTVRFHLDADPSPGLLPRLMQPFARRHLVPDTVQVRRDGPIMHVEIALTGISVRDARLIRGNLTQIVGVRRILDA